MIDLQLDISFDAAMTSDDQFEDGIKQRFCTENSWVPRICQLSPLHVRLEIEPT